LISILKRAIIASEGFEQKIKLVEIKNALIRETGNSIARGVFGVPTIIIKEPLFLGND
jgi:2-hydroxychromene-2-carboxylate isomerase